MTTVSSLDSGAVAPVSARESLFARLKKNRLSLFGGVLVLLAVFMAISAPFLPLQDPDAVDASSRLAPIGAPGHLLGTDELGRDILSRMFWGGRITLLVSIAATLIAMIAGTFLGLVSGYFLGWTDTVISRGIDVLMAFPYFLLALTVIAILGPGLLNGMLAIALVNVPFFARIIRGSTLSLREADYVLAAKGMGAGHSRILFRHILLNSLPTLVVATTINLGFMITAAAALSFLGLGVQPPTSDWGTMLASGRQYLSSAPHTSYLPGLAIFLTVLGFNLLGDGLRDALDPRMRD
ncbi:ABC transporter permease [Alphaproteobacteria bacterium KMM 3653]|uniref:ABC transporter permease n=2 Tax=Harenicola maris TaxID=2841044 RepID=A0AAP2CTN3_9RHOB|nr:ABC transporter permease [Harenicola maris]